MSKYFNEAGEPLMDGAAMRYEMYLDSTYEPDPDDFYDRYDESEDLCDWCQNDGWDDTRDDLYLCDKCCRQYDDQALDCQGGEDAYLDSYMEDRLTTMFG